MKDEEFFKISQLQWWNIPLFFGRLIIKDKRLTMYSERYGSTPSMVIGPWRFSWRKYRP